MDHDESILSDKCEIHAVNIKSLRRLTEAVNVLLFSLAGTWVRVEQWNTPLISTPSTWNQGTQSEQTWLHYWSATALSQCRFSLWSVYINEKYE